MIKKIYTPIGLHVECPSFLSDFNETCDFSIVFRKYSYIKSMKIRPMGAELFHADRRTDTHDQAYSRFAQFFKRA